MKKKTMYIIAGLAIVAIAGVAMLAGGGDLFQGRLGKLNLGASRVAPTAVRTTTSPKPAQPTASERSASDKPILKASALQNCKAKSYSLNAAPTFNEKQSQPVELATNITEDCKTFISVDISNNVVGPKRTYAYNNSISNFDGGCVKSYSGTNLTIYPANCTSFPAANVQSMKGTSVWDIGPTPTPFTVCITLDGQCVAQATQNVKPFLKDHEPLLKGDTLIFHVECSTCFANELKLNELDPNYPDYIALDKPYVVDSKGVLTDGYDGRGIAFFKVYASTNTATDFQFGINVFRDLNSPYLLKYGDIF